MYCLDWSIHPSGPFCYAFLREKKNHHPIASTPRHPPTNDLVSNGDTEYRRAPALQRRNDFFGSNFYRSDDDECCCDGNTHKSTRRSLSCTRIIFHSVPIISMATFCNQSSNLSALSSALSSLSQVLDVSEDKLSSLTIGENSNREKARKSLYELVPVSPLLVSSL